MFWMRVAGLSLLVLSSPLAVSAQVPSPRSTAERSGAAGGGRAVVDGVIQGVVRDASSGHPLASARVAARRAAGENPVASTLTMTDGSFTIGGLPAGRYLLSMSYLGAVEHAIAETVITADTPRVELGVIYVELEALRLDEVVATAERSKASFGVERDIYRVEEMPLASGSSAGEVLRSIPAVEVDFEGKISLRGSQEVVVQINGRATPMRGAQLVAFLQQLPADQIERVEVVPNPSASSDPDGTAGVINLVLRRGADLGRSGGVSLSGGSNGERASGNFGYQRGRLSLVAGMGHSVTELRGSATGGHGPVSPGGSGFMRQELELHGDFGMQNLNTSAELRLGTRSYLSTELLLTRGDRESSTTTTYTEPDPGRSLVVEVKSRAGSLHDHLNFDQTLAFRREIGPEGGEWTTSLRFNRARDVSRNDFSRSDLNDPALVGDEWRDITRGATLQTDYVRPLGERFRLEVGYKGTARRSENDLESRYRSLGDPGGPGTDIIGFSTFDFEEVVNAGYGVISGGFGQFRGQVGIRSERAHRTIALAGASHEDKFPNLYPSGHLAYEIDESKQVKASYSKRIWRPDHSLLKPFTMYQDPRHLFVGNPHLRPEHTHSFEVGYQQNGSFGSIQVAPFFRRTVDRARQFTTIADDGVATTTIRNLATTDIWGAAANGSWRLGPLSGLAGVNASRSVTSGLDEERELTSTSSTWSGRVNATWRVRQGLDLQGLFTHQAAQRIEQGRFSGFSMVQLSARQSLFGERANVTLRVVDPFDQMRMTFRVHDGERQQVTERRAQARSIHLAFGYSFGKRPKIRTRVEEEPEAAGGPDVKIR